MGNICRSPAAEIVFRAMVESAGLQKAVEIDSAGTIGYHRGSPPDHRMSRTLMARGYQPHGSARQVCIQDFCQFDLILPMDRENEADLRRINPSAERAEIRPFVSFCNGLDVDHVPDPYYGGSEGFEHVADIIENGCAGLIRAIQDQINEASS
jgi:protein-tyrosine phosphatase